MNACMHVCVCGECVYVCMCIWIFERQHLCTYIIVRSLKKTLITFHLYELRYNNNLIVNHCIAVFLKKTIVYTTAQKELHGKKCQTVPQANFKK